MKSFLQLAIFLTTLSFITVLLYKFDILGFRTNFSLDFIDSLQLMVKKPVNLQSKFLEEIKIQKDKNDVLTKEINNLKKELETREDYTKEYIEAQVINFEDNQLIINRGSASHVAVNQKVVVGKSFIGVVTSVEKNRSLVSLMNNPEVKVFCVVGLQEQRVWGVATGIGNRKTVLTRITHDKKVEKGDKVFCEGFLLGKISHIDKQENELFYEAEVERSVNPENVETVWVIAG